MNSVKDIIDLLSVIDARTNEIERVEASLATQRSERYEAYDKLSDLLSLPRHVVPKISYVRRQKLASGGST